MEKDFEKFMSQLAETNATLDFYSDFKKIRKNVNDIAISLNMLNFLLGKEDLRSAVEALWERDKTVFNVLDILIATRRKEVHRYRWANKGDQFTFYISRWSFEIL